MENNQQSENLGSQGNRAAHRFFLSHNSNDKPLIRELHGALAQRNVTAWFDEKNIPVTEIPIEAIFEGIGNSEVCLVCLGPGGVKEWQSWEITQAVTRAVKREMPIVTISLPGGPGLEERPPLLHIYSWVDFRSGWNDDGFAKLCEDHHATSLQPGQVPAPPLQEWSGSARVDESGAANKGLASEALASEGRKNAERKLRLVFGGTFETLKESVAEGSPLRDLLLSHFSVTSSDPDGQAMELLVHFHEQFLPAIGGFLELHESAGSEDRKRKLIDVLRAALYLALAPDEAARYRGSGESLGGATFRVPAGSGMHIQSILTSWIKRRRFVRPTGQGGAANGFGLDVPLSQGVSELKLALAGRIGIPQGDPETSKKLEVFLSVRDYLRDPVFVAVSDPKLILEIQAEGSPLRDLLVFVKVAGTSLRPSSRVRNFDEKVEMLVAELYKAFKLS